LKRNNPKARARNITADALRRLLRYIPETGSGETMGKVMSGLSKQVGNVARNEYGLPGDVAQRKFDVPAGQQMTEEDAYRLNQGDDTIANRATGLSVKRLAAGGSVNRALDIAHRAKSSSRRH
jgi:hypothetical protein